MKFSIISIVISCISLSGLPATANSLQSTNSPTAPAGSTSQALNSQINNAAVEPAALTVQGSAADLMVEERSPSTPMSDRMEAFSATAEQINQNLADPPEQQENPLNNLTEQFSLPQGVVVRGVNRGGIAIGSELSQ